MSIEDNECICQKCNSKFKMDLLIPDKLWKQISPKKVGGLLCPSCIIKAIEELKGYSAFKLEAL
jgi:hypothetical protein